VATDSKTETNPHINCGWTMRWNPKTKHWDLINPDGGRQWSYTPEDLPRALLVRDRQLAAATVKLDAADVKLKEAAAGGRPVRFLFRRGGWVRQAAYDQTRQAAYVDRLDLKKARLDNKQLTHERDQARSNKDDLAEVLAQRDAELVGVQTQFDNATATCEAFYVEDHTLREFLGIPAVDAGRSTTRAAVERIEQAQRVAAGAVRDATARSDQIKANRQEIRLLKQDLAARDETIADRDAAIARLRLVKHAPERAKLKATIKLVVAAAEFDRSLCLAMLPGHVAGIVQSLTEARIRNNMLTKETRSLVQDTTRQAIAIDRLNGKNERLRARPNAEPAAEPADVERTKETLQRVDRLIARLHAEPAAGRQDDGDLWLRLTLLHGGTIVVAVPDIQAVAVGVIEGEGDEPPVFYASIYLPGKRYAVDVEEPAVAILAIITEQGNGKLVSVAPEEGEPS